MVPKGELLKSVLHNAWRGEGPSDLYAKIWEEIWDKQLVGNL